jgi:Na+/H+-dicarboxylate symporter
MKIWFKYLIAMALGVALGLTVPLDRLMGPLDLLTQLGMNLARYLLIPLFFFSIPVAVYELHDDHRLLRNNLRIISYSLLALVVLTAVGIGGVLLLNAGRIPLSSDASFPLAGIPTLPDILKALLPESPAAVFMSPDFLLPLAMLAAMIGLAFSSDRTVTKPALNFFDSMSRISWHINSFIVEILPLPIILITTTRTIIIAASPRLQVFGVMLLVLGIQTAVVVFLLLPLLLILAGKKKNPYKILYALAAPAMAGLVMGSAVAAAGITAKHLKESLCIRRRNGATILPVALVLGRAGTAMVSATAFIVILSSYSSLGIGSATLAWMMLYIPLGALLLGAAPALGPLHLVAYLCAIFGKGFESGYILLVPVAMILQIVGAFLDVIISAVLITLTVIHERMSSEKTVRLFI